jgi:predicted amidohydrolase YtcJ
MTTLWWLMVIPSLRTTSRKRDLKSLRLALTVGLLAACAPSPADLVLRGGKVVTVDDAIPEAEAIAVTGDRVVAVGSNDAIAEYVGRTTEVIELDGKLVVPGFIEGHGHFAYLGRAMSVLDLGKADSWEEIVAMIAEAARDAEPGEWILGRGWHQEKWERAPRPSVEALPVHGSLSRVSPENPVFLAHASGHAAFANALALKLAGITRATKDPPGGEIVRDPDGDPTGALRETAQQPVGDAIERAQASRTEEEAAAEAVRAVELAGREALAKGVTSFHDAGASFEIIDLFKRLAAQERLPIRLYVMVRASNEEMAAKLPEYRTIGFGGGFLTVRSIKRQIDGALGPHGAWLLEPYQDLESTGLNLETIEDIEATAALAIQHGYQLNTHAIGDRANREVLDLYQRTFERNPGETDLRWRIEHAQHLHPDDIGRFAELGVIAAMQGVHCTSDGPWVLKRLGARRAEEGTYV